MKALLIALFISLGIEATAQIKVGQPLPPIAVAPVFNARDKKVNLSDLRGKVVLLEFWATWCTPCVAQMPHLQALQEAFKDKLRIIAVTTERKDRVEQFLQHRPSSLWFAIDTVRQLSGLFPHKIIPHTVLIDASGVVRAITEPVQVSKTVIGDLIAGKAIALPVKEDPPFVDPKTLVEKYFAATPQTENRLTILPAIEGTGGFEDRYSNDPNFRNRRITLINFPLNIIYRMAHGGITANRTVNLREDREDKSSWQSYCVDVIVLKGKEPELLPTLEKELSKRFAIHGKLEKQNKPVYVLQVADPAKIKQLTAATSGEGYLMAQGDSFEGKQVTIKQLTNYLENFGVVDLPVVDETGLQNTYDLSLKFEPQQKESLMAALQQIGLRLTEAHREIEVLVLK